MFMQKILDFIYIVFFGKYTFVLYLMHWYVMNILVNILNIDTRSLYGG